MPELNPVPEDYEDQFTGANVITPAQFIINEQRRATANTITSLDADPEQASRAQKLADATGAPPAIVFGNLENYEQQHKAAITSQLLSNNKFLMDYAESHPLAAKISNDDWGQLATVSDQAKYFAPRDVRAMGPEEIHAAGSVLAEAAKGFSEGVDYDSLSREHQRAVDWFAKQPVFANLFIRQAAIAGVTGLELANRLAGGVITGGAKAVAEMYRQSGIESVLPPEMSSERLLRDLIVAAQTSPVAFMGPHPQIEPTFAKVKPFLDEGKVPPPGIDPIIDKVHIEQAKLDNEALQKLFKEAQASSTKERAPELFQRFIAQHSDAKIGIPAERVAELYGEKVPAPDDNLLGQFNIADQLRVQAQTGGDIEIPLADWVAKADPKVMQELKDDIRVRPGGLTENEGKEIKTEPAKEPEGIDVYHGSPYEFEAFDVGKVGTGEGAQSYGHGLYLAEHPEVAKSYSQTAVQQAAWGGIRGDLEGKTPPGYLYKAKILRKPEEFLDWDKPLAEQPQILKLLEAHGDQSILGTAEKHGTSGREFYQRVGTRLVADRTGTPEIEKAASVSDITSKFASEELSKAGIPGIKYLDQFSRRLDPAELVDLKESVQSSKEEFEKYSKLAEDLSYNEANRQGFKEAAKSAKGNIERLSQYIKAQDKPQTRNYVVFSDKDVIPTHRGETPLIPPTEQAVESVRQAAGLAKPVQYVLQRQPVSEKVSEAGGHVFHILNENGGLVGAAQIGEEAGGKRLWVDMIATQDEGIRGFAGFRRLIPQIEAEFPNAKEIAGDTKRGLVKIPINQGVPASSPELAGLLRALAEKEMPKPEGEYGLILKGAKPTTEAQQLELDVTRMAEKSVFENAKAIGMTVDQYKRYMKKIAAQNAADVEWQFERAQEIERKKQTKEWKANEAQVRGEVERDITSRADVSADQLLNKGILYGNRVGKAKIDPKFLTPEQKAAFPEKYLKDGGLHPDDLAGLFGYGSGSDLVDNVSKLDKARKESELPPGAFLEKMIRDETNSRMLKTYGDLKGNILEAAQEHVISPTQLDILHEEILAMAERGKGQIPISKKDLERWAKDEFAQMPIGAVSSQAYLDAAGRSIRAAEAALLKDDPSTAFKARERQYKSLLMANQAKKLEKAMGQFDRAHERLQKREVPSMSGEDAQAYLNRIHEIYAKVGKKVKRSEADLSKSLKGQTLEDWIEEKRQHDMVEVDVPEFLLDPRYNKEFDGLTTEQFYAVHNTVKNLEHVGKETKKITSAGDAADLAEKKAEMIEQLRQFKERHYDPEGKRWLGPIPPKIAKPIRTYLASHLQLEGLFNRWDRGDPNGVFTQYVMRDLATAANEEAALERKYSQLLVKIADKTNLREKIDNDLFMNPLTRTDNNPQGVPIQMTRKHLRAILQNVGNDSNLTKLARGYGIGALDKNGKFVPNRQLIMDWINKHATKEDWDWAQGQGDIFEEIHKESDKMYRRLAGIEPEAIEINPIQTPHGTYRGWYHPVVYHPVWEGKSKKLMGGDPLEQNNYIRATTPASYTKQRTGYAAPLSLDLDQTPIRMRQMIHDIAFREAVVNAGKIFYDDNVRTAITKHYGVEYKNLLVPYLRDVANYSNYRSDAAKVGTEVSEFFRQNVIATLIGLNPGTVMKHGPTAAMNSITEVGPINFLKAVKGLTSINEETGETNWSFAMNKSSELQRRTRNYIETLGGAQERVLGKNSMRDTLTKLGATPVAMSDLLSAVPTWLAKYETMTRNGADEGTAIYEADRAVRRAHGSTAVTNRPGIARGGPLASWLSSLYGFFSHILNRQYELAWRAGETLGKVKAGDYAEAAKDLPRLSSMLFSYIIFPAIVEEIVTPYTNAERDSWGMKAAKTLVRGVSSSWIGIRDMVQAVINNRDPSAGLLTTGWKTGTDLARDLKRGKEMFSRQHAGSLIQHGFTAFGALTGLTNAQEGKTARFIYDYSTGQQRPRGAGDWWRGLRSGQIKERK